LTVKVDYLPDGPEDAPVLRFEIEDGCDVRRLIETMRKLAAGMLSEVHLTASADHGRDALMVTMTADGDPLGATLSNDGYAIRWVLTRQDWEVAAEFVEPFTEIERGGFQWLSGPEARSGLTTAGMAVLITSYEGGKW
jgi:hypothetical protein